MSLAAVRPRVVYTGSGSPGPFAVSYGGIGIYYRSNSHIKVKRLSTAGAESTLTENVDYTLTAAPTSNGYVTLTVALAVGETLAIYRDQPYSQDVSVAGNFAASDVNAGYDQLEEKVQEIGDRALKLSPFDTLVSGILPVALASALLAWNAAGTGFQNVQAATFGAAIFPTSSTNRAMVRFDGTTGRAFKDTPGFTVSDAGFVDIVAANAGAGQARLRYDTLGAGLLINQVSSGGAVTINNQANAAIRIATNNNDRWIIGADGSLYATFATGADAFGRGGINAEALGINGVGFGVAYTASAHPNQGGVSGANLIRADQNASFDDVDMLTVVSRDPTTLPNSWDISGTVTAGDSLGFDLTYNPGSGSKTVQVYVTVTSAMTNASGGSPFVLNGFSATNPRYAVALALQDAWRTNATLLSDFGTSLIAPPGNFTLGNVATDAFPSAGHATFSFNLKYPIASTASWSAHNVGAHSTLALSSISTALENNPYFALGRYVPGRTQAAGDLIGAFYAIGGDSVAALNTQWMNVFTRVDDPTSGAWASTVTIGTGNWPQGTASACLAIGRGVYLGNANAFPTGTDPGAGYFNVAGGYKVNNVANGSAFFANTGTSGHALPYLDGVNTWSASNSWSGGGYSVTLNPGAGAIGVDIIGAFSTGGLRVLHSTGSGGRLQQESASGIFHVSNQANAALRFSTNNTSRWLIGATGGFYAEGVTGTDEGSGTINATDYYVSGTASSGTGGLVRATSPTLVTPALGTPSSGVLSNCTGYPASALSGLGTGVATWLATPSSANLRSALTDSTGTGVNVFDTAPTFTTSITSPKVIGGTGTGSTLTLQSTSGVGATDGIAFDVGNNGATHALYINKNGHLSIGYQNTSDGGAVALDILNNGGGGQMRFRYDTSGSGVLIAQNSSGGDVAINNQANARLIYSTNNIDRLYIQAGGGVSIGTSTDPGAACLTATGKFGIGSSTAPSHFIDIAAGTTTVAPLRMASGTNLTSAVAGCHEFDGVQFYKTIDATSGRGAVPVEQYFHLTADGSTISTIANFFGSTSNISLVANAYYEIEIFLWYLKTTADTVVWTLTNSAAPTSQNIVYRMSPVTGIVAPPGTATMLEGQIEKDATAAKTITTGTLTTAVEHFAYFKIFLQNGSGTSLKVQATSTSGTITPRLGSRWIARRMSPNNIGTFAA